jgi:putative flippase GtrA
MEKNHNKISMIISGILSKQNSNYHFQFIRYTISGGIAFITDFIILYILTDILNIYYLISAGIAFIAGVSVIYTFSIIWVFDIRRFQNKRFELSLFILISFFGLLLTELFMWFFTDMINFHYLLSKIISSALILWWNFFSKKIILFS